MQHQRKQTCIILAYKWYIINTALCVVYVFYAFTYRFHLCSLENYMCTCAVQAGVCDTIEQNPFQCNNVFLLIFFFPSFRYKLQIYRYVYFSKE